MFRGLIVLFNAWFFETRRLAGLEASEAHGCAIRDVIWMGPAPQKRSAILEVFEQPRLKRTADERADEDREPHGSQPFRQHHARKRRDGHSDRSLPPDLRWVPKQLSPREEQRGLPKHL
jgi:hypothetical protein